MKAPKNRQSDERNSHIASLALVTPVGVGRGRRGRAAGTAGSSLGVCSTVASIGVVQRPACGHAPLQSSGSCPGLEAPGEHAEQEHEQTRGSRASGFAEHGRVAEERAAQGEDERVERRRRHVDAVTVPWRRCAVGRGRRPTRRRAAGGSRTSRPSASSVYLRCQQSSRASTSGISAKLYSGGGDGIDHSSERPSHGSSRRADRAWLL